MTELQRIEQEFGLETESLDGTEWPGEDRSRPPEHEYVNIDSWAAVEDDFMATTGIYHCVGVVFQSDYSFLSHETPGNLGGECNENFEEFIKKYSPNPGKVSYVIGDRPSRDLLESITQYMESHDSVEHQEIVYTGSSGVVLDSSGKFHHYSLSEKKVLESSSPLAP